MTKTKLPEPIDLKEWEKEINARDWRFVLGLLFVTIGIPFISQTNNKFVKLAFLILIIIIGALLVYYNLFYRNKALKEINERRLNKK